MFYTVSCQGIIPTIQVYRKEDTCAFKIFVLVRASLGSRETSKILLAGGQMVFFGDLPFSPHLTMDSSQN